MPIPDVIPVFKARKKKRHYVLRKEGTPDVYFGQLKGWTPDETINTTEEGRVGDATKYQDREDKTSNLNMVIYVDDTYEEVALLLGETLNKSTGWVGNEVIKLNPDSTAGDYAIEVWSTADDTGVLVGTHYADNWQPTSFSMPVEDGTGSIVATINGVCDDFYYTPEAGIGSTS